MSADEIKSWGLTHGETVLGHNLFLDSGRQALVYAFGGKVGEYTVEKVGFGTGTSVSNITMTALESPVELTTGSGTYTKNVDGIDYPSPFVVRVTFTIGSGECNGFNLTEFGLFTGNNVLIARFVNETGLNKTLSKNPSLSWRMRL